VDLDLTPDQELLRDTTRKFLRATVPLTAVRALAENAAGFDRRWWQRGAELGWTSLLVDERRGGGSISGEGLRDLALVAEERTLKGSYVGSSVPQRDVPRMIALFRAGRLPVDQLLTHRLNLSEINEGFDRLREGVGVRQVILFE